MSRTLSFQKVILRLQRYWSDYGCTIWQPYSEKLGAGTMNPATYLRVLGPEPLGRATTIIGNDGGSNFENIPRRPIILLQQYNFSFRVVLLKV